MAINLRSERFSPNEKKKVIYQDILYSSLFDRDTKDIFLLSNEDSVKQSILSILLTNRGERPFSPLFGSDINKILFENVTPQTTTQLISFITNAIENFEPRANLINVLASPLPDENAYTVTVVFSVINKTEPITLDFLLNRVR